MAMATQQKTLVQQKVAVQVKLMMENESLWAALLIFLGALFLLNTFPFYPIYLTFILAIVCGGVAYKVPWAGTGLSMVLTFPAVAYQSPLFAWVFAILLSATFFKMFSDWAIVSTLQVLVLSPFAFHGTALGSFFGWFTIVGMLVASFHFGSKKSLFMSVVSILLILLLSSIWLIENSAYLPLNLKTYQPASEYLTITKKTVEITGVMPALSESLGKLFSAEVFTGIGNAIGKPVENILKILFSDSGFLQIASWVIVLYLVNYLSGIIKSKKFQTMSSLAYLLIIPVYYFISTFGATSFRLEFAGMVVSSVIVMGVLEHFGVQISREKELERSEKVKGFGKFGIQDLSAGTSESSLADFGGYEDVKQELLDAIVTPLEKKELAYTYGLKAPAGILLFGPPGTGKTMLMRALAKELKYGFYYIKSSELMSQWFGESEKNVNEVFEIARKSAPAILFFDEIDSIGKSRTLQSDDVGQRVLTALLQQMDGGLKGKKPVIVIGATNVPQQLDPALMRPGRLDKIIYMHLPDPKAREAIFKVHLRKLPTADIDYAKLVEKTNRFSGADLKNVVNEAIKITAKEATAKGVVMPVTTEHIMDVVGRVRPSTSLASMDDYDQFRLDFERRIGAQKEEKKKDAITWDQVAGLGKVKKALLDTIELPLLHEEEMKELKIKPAKGILLFGPPGTGKTLIVKAASSELKASFQSLSGAEVMKKGYTQAVIVIKEVFNRARENTPAIVFVDEIETIAPARGDYSSGLTGQFLTEMDGMKDSKGVVVIATTNKPDLLDSAILRPGRFDKIFYISPPDAEGRSEIFKIHLGKLAEKIDTNELAKVTEGFSGADIASACQNLKMKALEQKIGGKEINITTSDAVELLSKRRPSVTPKMLVEYEKFIKEYGERT